MKRAIFINKFFTNYFSTEIKSFQTFFKAMPAQAINIITNKKGDNMKNLKRKSIVIFSILAYFP